MRFLINRLLPLIGIMALMSSYNAKAQELTFLVDSTANVVYSMQIDFENAYVSGLCVLARENDIIKSSIVNEFGVSIIDFVYKIKKNKVELKYVMSTLDKWYLKRILRKDLREIMHIMQSGGTEYINNKRGLKYTFFLMEGNQYSKTDN